MIGFNPSGAHFRPVWRICLAVALLTACLVFPTAATAGGVRLDGPVLDNRDGFLSVRFDLLLQDRVHIESLLRDGAMLAVRCRAVLSERRSWWLDRTIVERDFISTLYADPLTREFVMSLPGEPRSHRGRDLAAMAGTRWRGLAMRLCSSDELERGGDYALDLSITVRHEDVPDWVKTTLFFHKWDAVPSSSSRMEFRF